MPCSSCVHDLAIFQVILPIIGATLGGIAKRSICQQLQCHNKREWFFIPVMMEVNAGSSRYSEKRSLEGPTSANDVKMPIENNGSTSVYVNHAAVAWHESRRKWVGDQNQRSQRMPKDPILSWSMTYDDLLSTTEPFPERIPLPEMVDFLVDIWHDDGLYD